MGRLNDGWAAAAEPLPPRSHPLHSLPDSPGRHPGRRTPAALLQGTPLPLPGQVQGVPSESEEQALEVLRVPQGLQGLQVQGVLQESDARELGAHQEQGMPQRQEQQR